MEEIAGLPDSSESFSQATPAIMCPFSKSTLFPRLSCCRLSVDFNVAMRRGMAFTGNTISVQTAQSCWYGLIQAPGSASINSAIVTADLTSASVRATVKNPVLPLDQWKGMLPVYLRWQEDQPRSFPSPSQELYSPTMCPQPTHALQSLQQTAYTFTTGLDAALLSHPYALDIQVAILRTRS